MKAHKNLKKVCIYLKLIQFTTLFRKIQEGNRVFPTKNAPDTGSVQAVEKPLFCVRQDRGFSMV